MTPPDHLSPQQFSRRSGLSIASVRRYLRDGRLPFAQPGGPRGRVLIPADALERLAAGEARRPANHPPNQVTPARGADGTPTRRPGPVPAWRRGRAS